ncbi:hypothetical protein HIM_05547 [Hirsutella minnesotensis 3608]|uniref:Myb-like domain-containing protein n=1 Tax=Hirsutella minnesotensis 3608 TaxID=1043627 RepID=A0A0F7ZK90_9HYPO|nr:hypothetical protein HIM_05547 [Hirsutella minnesotensis 3608]
MPTQILCLCSLFSHNLSTWRLSDLDIVQPQATTVTAALFALYGLDCLALHPVAELAQLKSQTLLCLPRAEPPFQGIASNSIGLFRGSSTIGIGRGEVGRGRKEPLNVDIASLLKTSDSNESPIRNQQPRHLIAPQSTTSPPAHGHLPAHGAQVAVSGSMSNPRRSMPPQVSEQPVKKQSKWSPEEDALIIELRGSGMKWEDVSKRLPGRSAISCRLHYQNYLERRSEWDEERKNKLARLYERFKAEMWAKVAEELAVPWRAAEAMHWQLGEADMARRAGVVPFSLAAVNVEGGQRSTPRSSGHFQPPEVVARHLTPPSPRSMYARSQPLPAMPMSQAIRGEPMPPQPQPGPTLPPSMGPDHGEVYYTAGPGLAPIQTQGQPRNPGPLPSLAELTTGVSPYGTPLERPRSGPLGPPPKHGPMMHTAPGGYETIESSRPKRRASPDSMPRDSSIRRRIA